MKYFLISSIKYLLCSALHFIHWTFFPCNNNFCNFTIILEHNLYNKYNERYAWVTGDRHGLDEKSHKIGAARNALTC